jgi:hypothetical protein
MGDGDFERKLEAWRESRGELLPGDRRRQRRAAWLRGAGLVALVAGGAAVFLLFWEPEAQKETITGLEEFPEPIALPPAELPSPSPEVLAEAEVPSESESELPALAASDGWVRDAVAALSRHDALAEWLLSEDLIRRFAAAVDNVAEGKSPRKHLTFLTPVQPFRTLGEPEVLAIDPASYRRYDLLAEVVSSIDSAGTARAYRRMEPLIDEAYRGLGYPDRDFEVVLGRAVEELLLTPIVDDPVELVPRVISYEYRDPELESLSPVQKQLLRTGPDNLRRIQGKIREIAAELGLSIDPALAVAGSGGE